MNKLLLLLSIFLLSCATGSKNVVAQKSTQNSESISKKVSQMTKYQGYFTYYYDGKSDKIWLEIENYNKEFLYINSLSAGVGSNDIGLDRAQLGNSRIVYFERMGNKIMMVQPNYSYRAISDNDLEVAAVDDAFARSIIWGFKVDTEENGKVLVDATNFFIRDAHNVIGRLKRGNQGNYSLDKTRSAFYLPAIKNFPLNSEFETTLTFKGTPTGSFFIRPMAEPAGTDRAG